MISPKSQPQDQDCGCGECDDFETYGEIWLHELLCYQLGIIEILFPLSRNHLCESYHLLSPRPCGLEFLKMRQPCFELQVDDCLWA